MCCQSRDKTMSFVVAVVVVAVVVVVVVVKGSKQKSQVYHISTIN